MGRRQGKAARVAKEGEEAKGGERRRRATTTERAPASLAGGPTAQDHKPGLCHRNAKRLSIFTKIRAGFSPPDFAQTRPVRPPAAHVHTP